MQEEVCLHFVSLNFLSCYHVENMFYEWSSTQALFEEGIHLCGSTNLNLEKNSMMQLLQWNGSVQEQDYQTERVLVQILKITPLIFEEGQQRSAVLHEIAIVPWSCEAIESIGLYFTKIFKLRRLENKRIFVVLSRVIDADWIHCLKNGHLGSLLSKEKFDKIVKDSVYLEKDLQEKLEWDVVVKTGSTEQKAVANCQLASKVNKMRCSVYDQIDISFATLDDISSACTLIDPRLFSTQNLKLVFQTSNYNDTSTDH